MVVDSVGRRLGSQLTRMRSQYKSSLDSLRQETYMHPLRALRAQARQYITSDASEASDLVSILRARDDRTTRVTSELQREARDTTLTFNLRSILLSILYRGTDDDRWKAELFELLLQYARSQRTKATFEPCCPINAAILPNRNDREASFLQLASMLSDSAITAQLKTQILNAQWQLIALGPGLDPETLWIVHPRETLTSVRVGRDVMLDTAVYWMDRTYPAAGVRSSL